MIPQEYLNSFNKVYLETTSFEKFELQRIDDEYLLIDTTPPILEMAIVNYKSAKTSKKNIKTLVDHGGDNIILDNSGFLYYDGIIKGFNFMFFREKEVGIMSKGKIELCYIKQDFSNITFNIHLLEPSGRKVDTKEFKYDMVIKTDRGSIYEFQYKDGELYFENRVVASIFSLFKTKNLPFLELLTEINEYDVSPRYLFYNRPFIISTEDPDSESKLKPSFIFENVLSIEKI